MLRSLFQTHKQEFVKFINCMVDAIYVMEVKNNTFYYTVMNIEGMKLSGLTERAIGETIDTVLPKDRAEYLMNQYRQVLQERKSITFEAITANGDIGESILTPIFDEEKKEITYILSVTRDISIRKKMEKRLEESEERYRLIAENSTNLIQLVDSDGNLIYASPSFKKILGYHPIDKSHSVFGQFHDCGKKEEFKKQFESALCKKETVSIEMDVQHENGSILWLKVDIIPIFEIGSKISKMLIVAKDITESKEYEKEIRFMAYHDPLTGLPNRGFFKEYMLMSLERAKKNSESMACLFLDCDNFKQLNDAHGHDAGDKFLQSVAKRLHSELQKDDMIARIGGDEFNILLSQMNSKQHVSDVAQRLLKVINEPWPLSGGEWEITASIGIALYPEDGDTMETLLKHADIALYDAKNNGRNQYKWYDASLY
ncbi:diguanylate cyclase [Evansella cellulosilytica]|uniref:Diguanylate cyclase with PAS/PAC sensor n=1 Tax=Evansella cellulosilytica (strain ATCC 21833 / DSM 2522 / FERM P-1141 / JCM 9156 / N-4) TaxID=649639 RepID=E6TSD4_EVAC2|nr:diguanylate cyclase [Evansella cellulosilytica]ADU31903.1 diguanylate cyclase with PAS/PAC sensor [Evansella cellulosilytica DSM 2522]